MSKEKAQLGQLKQAIDRLEEVLDEAKTPIIRDSAIKRFEMAFDLAWKTLKTYLSEEKGVTAVSPKDVFRSAYKNGVMEYEEEWLVITDRRNLTVHSYDEKLADEIYNSLPEALKLFKELFNRISS